MFSKRMLLLLALCAAACGAAQARPHHLSSVGPLYPVAGQVQYRHRQQGAGQLHGDAAHHKLQRAIAHRRLLQTNATTNRPPPPVYPVCEFTNATPGQSVSGCGPSQLFLLNLAFTTNLSTTASPFAAAPIKAIANDFACYRHDASTPAGADACDADYAHSCFLLIDDSTGGLYCVSLSTVADHAAQACPGSDAYKYAVCQAANRTSCQANPDCIWSVFGGGVLMPLLTQESAAAYEAQWQSVTNGTRSINLGFCQFRAEFEAATAPSNGTAYSWMARYNWGASTLASTDQETYYAYNGNCSLAVKSYAATSYSIQCNSFNQVPVSTNPGVDLGLGLMRSDLPPNVTNVQGCIENKCALNLRYSAGFPPQYRPFLNYTGAYSCEADPGLSAALLYDKETDGDAWTAMVECNSFHIQFDREACEGVKPEAP